VRERDGCAFCTVNVTGVLEADWYMLSPGQEDVSVHGPRPSEASEG
jgi:hypothetical protein